MADPLFEIFKASPRLEYVVSIVAAASIGMAFVVGLGRWRGGKTAVGAALGVALIFVAFCFTPYVQMVNQLTRFGFRFDQFVDLLGPRALMDSTIVLLLWLPFASTAIWIGKRLHTRRLKRQAKVESF